MCIISQHWILKRNSCYFSRTYISCNMVMWYNSWFRLLPTLPCRIKPFQETLPTLKRWYFQMKLLHQLGSLLIGWLVLIQNVLCWNATLSVRLSSFTVNSWLWQFICPIWFICSMMCSLPIQWRRACSFCFGCFNFFLFVCKLHVYINNVMSVWILYELIFCITLFNHLYLEK